MTRIVQLCLMAALTLSGGPAQAGAWMRETSSWFVSTTTRLVWPKDVPAAKARADGWTYHTIYAEYGVSERLTLGVDIGVPREGEPKVIVFMRKPIRQPDTGTQIAWDLGVGTIAGDTVIRPGLGIGRGLENGWLNADAMAEISVGEAGMAFKLDLTYGINLARDRKIVLQVQSSKTAEDPFSATFAPSVIFPLTDSLSAEVGGSYGFHEDETMGLLLGLWADF
ncbi:hypothetical protein GCM10011415_19020 [Salipiger pallidus]|uniref:Transporter n=1 Tax=Salipiger pallidus TaxID=1775170 RepID=A0A8J2ZJC3_9RHOB|nr:hypothetical protein [Salipiger pallidus]GGG71375.1 hypothetical protein GCM10011415_19020 [Salipiger pallidus]